MFPRSGLPHRPVLRLLRCPSRPYSRGLCQYLGGGEGPGRLGGHLQHRTGDSRAPGQPGPQDHLGAGQTPGCLHREEDGRRDAALAGSLYRPRRVQGQGPARAQGPEPGCGRAGAPGVPGFRHRTGRCGGFHQPAHQGGPRAAPAEADRGDRSRHLLQDAAGLPGQGDGGGADRWRWCHLPQLCPLSLDGDERPGGDQGGTDRWRRASRDPGG
ncbi:hypothetical protein D3C72_1358820 [compost metagenome]